MDTPANHRSTKHIHVRSRSLRDRIQLGQIVVEYLNTENIAHMLTQTSGATGFVDCIDELGMS